MNSARSIVSRLLVVVRRWPSWTKLVAAAACSVALFLLARDQTHLCYLPSLSGLPHRLVTRSGVSHCLEYYLNRYQTGLGVLTAVWAASLAYRASLLQVNYNRAHDLRRELSEILDLRSQDLEVTSALEVLLTYRLTDPILASLSVDLNVALQRYSDDTHRLCTTARDTLMARVKSSRGYFLSSELSTGFRLFARLAFDALTSVDRLTKGITDWNERRRGGSAQHALEYISSFESDFLEKHLLVSAAYTQLADA